MKPKGIILLLSLTFIIIVCWTGFNIYDNHVASTISDTLNIRVFPINPNFDTTTFEKLKNRKSVSSSFNASESPELKIKEITPQPNLPSVEESTGSSQIPTVITPTIFPTLTQSPGNLNSTP